MTFERQIRRARVWIGFAAACEGLVLGLVFAAALLFIALLASKLVVAHVSWTLILIASAFIPVAVAIWRALLRWPRGSAAALAIDSSYGLKERFTTAWHMRGTHTPFANAILSDAERFAPGVRVLRITRPQVGRTAIYALLLVIAGAAIWKWLPERDLFGRKSALRAREVAAAAITKQVRDLASLQHNLEMHASGTTAPLEPSRKLAQDIADLQKQLEKPSPAGARDALAKLSSVADRVQQEKEKLERQSQQIKAGESGGNPQSSTDRLERALRHGDVAQAKAELERLKNQALGSGDAKTSEARQIGSDLSRTADSVGASDKLGKSLARAASSLQSGDAKGASASFNEAASALDEVAGMQEEARRLDAAMAQLERSKRELAAAAQAGEPGVANKPPSQNGSGSGQPGGSQSGSGGTGSQSGQTSGSATGSGGQSGSGTAGSAQASGGKSGGSGKGSGSGSGSGSSSGDGNSGPDWGRGTTNLGTEGGYDVAAKDGHNRQANRDSRWTEDFVKLYDPRQTAVKTQTQQATGKMGEGKFDFATQADAPATRETARTESRESLMSYKEAQKDAISREDIPPGYKDLVKRYFDSLDAPERR